MYEARDCSHAHCTHAAMDVGKNSYNIIKVRKAFEVAHTTLLALPTAETASLSLLSRIVRYIAQPCLLFVVTLRDLVCIACEFHILMFSFFHFFTPIFIFVAPATG